MHGLPHLFLITISILISLGVASMSRADDFEDQLPRIPPTEAKETLKKFEVADGFEIRLVASEPLVTSPVAIEWDARGAMFVCEMRGYSEDREDAISRITRLVDDNDDGVFDRHTIFADGLLWPTALFPYGGGLFVADAPNIYYFKDENDDGVADSKQVIFTGFSTGNVQGLLNSFRWGLDNRIHLACGTVGGKVRKVTDDASKAVEVRGHDLAFDPKTFEFSLTSGGAQHGMCFDDWGHKFVSSNSDHLQQVMYEDRYIARNSSLAAPSARQSIAADGPQAEVFRISPVEPWRIVRTRLRVAGLVRGPIEGGGRAAGYFTGATGVTIFRGDAWPEPLGPLAIVGDVGSNLVHRKRLTADGVQMVGRRIDKQSEFVASKDNWFRPAQFGCGPDGTLSIVDVYREVIEHPKSLPPEIKRHLDLTSGRNRGRIYRVVPNGYVHRKTPQMDAMGSLELVDRLQHPNAWHRETAARLLFERQDHSVETALRRQTHECDRALGRLHSLYALDGLGRLAADDVIRRFNDPHPQVVRHAVRLSESFTSNTAVVDAMRPLVRHPSIEVRYQLAFSLGEFPIDDRHQWLIELIQQSPSDRWIQTAVASSAGDAQDQLFVGLLQSASSAQHSSFLLQLATQIDRENRIVACKRSLEAIGDAPDRPSLLPIIGILNRAERKTQIGNQLASRIQTKLDRLIPLALEQVSDTGRSDHDRVNAIGWLANAPMKQVLPVLLELVQTSTSSELQIAAIRAMRRFDDPQVTATLLEGWPQWSPRLRGVAGDVLFANSKRTAAVLDAIDEKQIAPADISMARWNALSASRDEAIRDRVKKILATNKNTSRERVIKEYQGTLKLVGDEQRGFEVFKKQCAGCHKSAGVGHELGPSLAAAATRGPESILTNVLDPNREVNPQYVNYVLLTEDGRTATGMIVAENANSITLRRAESVSESVFRQDIELIRSTNQSIMPEGLEKAIPPQAMADLIEYLIVSTKASSE